MKACNPAVSEVERALAMLYSKWFFPRWGNWGRRRDGSSTGERRQNQGANSASFPCPDPAWYHFPSLCKWAVCLTVAITLPESLFWKRDTKLTGFYMIAACILNVFFHLIEFMSVHMLKLFNSGLVLLNIVSLRIFHYKYLLKQWWGNIISYFTTWRWHLLLFHIWF